MTFEEKFQAANDRILIPYDLPPEVRNLSPEHRCRLIDAMMEYVHSGKIPDFTQEPPDSSLTAVWPFFRDEADAQLSELRKEVENREFAKYRRYAQRRKLPIPTKAQWREAGRPCV